MKSSDGKLKILLTKVRESAFAPVDIASLVFFRIAFGALLIWHVWSYCALNRVGRFWLEPRFLFKFCGFSWVHPWSAHWLYIHWVAIGVLALFVAIGFFYRASAALLFLSYTYFFLLDEAQYVNHTYLICLFSFLFIFVPAHRAFSVDAWLYPRLRSNTTPAWSLWLLRAQMGVVYFYGGIAKLTPDWLRGEPMRTRLSHRTDFPIFGRFLHEEWGVYLVSYGAILLDLFLVPLLLWRRTRIAAFCVAVAFHLTNARWFEIGIFPWLAIAATALFLSPSWPRRFVGFFRRVESAPTPSDWKLPSARKQFVVLSFVTLYIAIQIIVPLRHFLWSGGIEWRYAEHRFSWRMMMNRYYTLAYFYVTDPSTGRTLRVNPGQFLNERQTGLMATLPDYPLQFAHFLANVVPRRGPEPIKVEARIFVSLNGRKPELYLDPNVDLAAEPRTLGRPRWLLSIHEPLPPPNQNYPSANPFELRSKEN
ncbi:MAG TPA: HTTM domain-containing protein [Chthoniobacterales bacterium]|jgi:hypothetical protein|nr:HTTM domain-containing protein [Chthoniobacterales bacterium]